MLNWDLVCAERVCCVRFKMQLSANYSKVRSKKGEFPSLAGCEDLSKIYRFVNIKLSISIYRTLNEMGLFAAASLSESAQSVQ